MSGPESTPGPLPVIPSHNSPPTLPEYQKSVIGTPDVVRSMVANAISDNVWEWKIDYSATSTMDEIMEKLGPVLAAAEGLRNYSDKGQRDDGYDKAIREQIRGFDAAVAGMGRQ